MGNAPSREARPGHSEILTMLAKPASGALVFGVVATALRREAKGSLAWWEWTLGPLIPLGAFALGLALLVVVAKIAEKPCRRLGRRFRIARSRLRRQRRRSL